MLKQTWQLATGATLVIVGGVQAALHNMTADPMAAFWCRTADLTAPEPGLFTGLMSDLSPHCWGCYAAAAGAAIMAHAGYKALMSKPAVTPTDHACLLASQ